MGRLEQVIGLLDDLAGWNIRGNGSEAYAVKSDRIARLCAP
jgi:hypothetical protein